MSPLLVVLVILVVAAALAGGPVYARRPSRRVIETVYEDDVVETGAPVADLRPTTRRWRG